MQPKYAQIVASMWITSGRVQFLKNKNRFRTAWVIRDRVEPVASPAMSVIAPKAEVNSKR